MSDNKQLKAGIWYTISNFFVSGISFLATPVFTRLMSTSDYGLFSTYNAWRSILLVVVTMQMAASINRARFDFEGKIDRYVSSIATVSIAIPSIIYLIIASNSTYFTKILGIDEFAIHVLFLSVIFPHIVDIYIMEKRIFYEYKISVFITILNSILTLGLSILLVLILRNSFWGRIIGQAIPVSVIGIVLYIILLRDGKGVECKYIKYAIGVSLPFIPHLLAANILTQSDRIIITNIIGTTENALYSVACTCSMLINILLSSINSAWTPWLGEKIQEKNYGVIKERIRPLIWIFFVAYIGAIVISPELILILGGEKYKGALSVMPPLITATMFQFVYTQYVNIEQFEKKIWRVALFTLVSAIINVGANYILIPIVGYQAAAYTTLFSYMVMCLLNYLSVRSMGLSKAYDNSFFAIILLVSLCICVGAVFVYRINAIRYTFIGLYVILVGVIIYRNKQNLFSLIKRER